MKIDKKVELSNLTTVAVGGKADFFCEAKSEDDLQTALEFAKSKKLPIFILGGGSNVVFSDKGFRGLVIRDQISNIKVDGTTVHVTAGTPLPLLNRELMAQELSGLEKLFGLPGTIGGAVSENSGVPKCNISDVLSSAQILDIKTGKIETVKKSWFKFGYRTCKLKQEPNSKFLISIDLNMKKGKKQEMEKMAFGEISLRKTKQPIGRSSGCFFRNPSSSSAGMLIDKAGLKGLKVGGVLISDKHANFFLNTGKATQKDFIDMAKKVKKEVKKQFKATLEPEVQLFDEKGKIIKI